MDETMRAAAMLREARHVVVFTGAGMSAESGVPTFRDDLTGLWSRYDAQRLATPEAFRDDPDLVWGWYRWRAARVRAARPNPGHVAVAALETRVPTLTLITQNVDDLHERAGSSCPIHLHGSLFAPRCAGCARPFPAELATADVEPAEGRRIAPPRCAICADAIRPGVVWFGELLPEDALAAAYDAATACDLALTIGTSGVVYPAAEIPRIAARSGAPVIQINPERSALDASCDLNLRGGAATLLPALLRTAWHTP
ncbi:SIR2 family NAD-dependent protein deacylase [Catenuloplanes atrovinosus]|uniref:NAD-dependent protein deacylase n=1 Tax=Catenuloplanes atrovinosus TaxID=137266 RepID=A0AAE4CAX8_9ACTN|nr:NAD-dependent protein deacylase [Catenuloplanes atrovinosus]MDR7275040.1 NAD-dependent deacetylase [Catenuloplanes atrovinosus]